LERHNRNVTATPRGAADGRLAKRAVRPDGPCERALRPRRRRRRRTATFPSRGRKGPGASDLQLCCSRV